MTRILAAKYVLPIVGAPIVGGAVAIDGSVVAAVGELELIRKGFPDADLEDHGDAAILPGFVNCHSHLELTAMRGALDSVEDDFRAWLLKVQELRSSMSD